MTTTETRHYGAAKIRIKPGNMDNIIADLWRDNPGATTEAIVDLFGEILRTQPETRLLAAEYCVTNRTRGPVARYAPELTPTAYIERSDMRTKAKAAKHDVIKKAVPIVFSFLNSVLPGSGKLARDANAPELIEAGGIFLANGKKLHREYGDHAKYGDVYSA